MHSRLPLFAGVPGKSAAAVLTTALLITGCTPNPFGPSDPLSMQPASAAQAAPEAIQETAESTMTEAASAVAERLEQARPSTVAPASSSTEDSPPGEDDDSEDTDPEGTAAAAPSRHAGVDRHRDQIDSWSESVSTAHQAAQEQLRREAEEAAEQQRLQQEAAEAERRAEEEALAEAEQQATEESADPEPEAEEPAAESVPQLDESLAAPSQDTESNLEYTGDLNSYLQDLVHAHPGDISISLQELSGQQRSASTGGHTARVTASTYKLYVAYSILRQVESGALSWEDPITNGRDLAQCFQDMIVISDNPCPEQIGADIGWTHIYSDAAAAGSGGTGQGQGAIVTSAQDLTTLLVNLETGQLNMSEAGHQRLLEAMAANVHRLGVPAGSAGQVLNKPGWISGYIHDAAIVRHPQGTYVLSIMSEGSSWGSLASITRNIEAALYGG